VSTETAGRTRGTDPSAARDLGWLRRLGQRIGIEPPTPREGRRYNGFISYSHAADGALAPALQRGLQRFAKPWYRARALWIFRDDTSLTATPHLWSSIRDALDDSEFFILLASPDAARSPWVDREAQHWCATKPPERLLVALTDGALNWNEDRRDFDWSSTDALPSSLSGVFHEEPRFIDLRWARNAPDLTLDNRLFFDAVADLAAPLHHKLKEEIASEEVRQHRLTLRIARGAGAALVLLAAAAILAGGLAVAARDTALSEKRAAESSSLSAQSSADLAGSYDRAGLESIESYRLSQTDSARSAVVTALEQPTTAILHGHRGVVNAVSFNADGTLVASGGEDGTLRLWDVVSRREVGKPLNLIGQVKGYGLGATDSSGQVTAVAFSPAGGLLAAASVIDTYSKGGIALESERGTVTVWNTAENMRTVLVLPDPGHEIRKLAFSPDGHLLAIATDDGTVALLSVAKRAFVALPARSVGAPANTGLSFRVDGRELAYVSGQQIRFWDVTTEAPTGPTISYPNNGIAFDPKQPNLIAAVGFDDAVRVFDADTGQQRSAYNVSSTTGATDLAFSPDGGRIAVSINDQTPVTLVDVGAGTVLGPAESMSGSSDKVESVAFNPAGSEVATANDDGTVRIFTVPGLSGLAYVLPGSVFGSSVAVAQSTVAAVNTNAIGGSSVITLWGLTNRVPTHLSDGAFSSDLAISPDARLVAIAGEDGTVHFITTSRGIGVGHGIAGAHTGAIAFSPDGRFLAGAAAKGAQLFNVAKQTRSGPPLPVANRVSSVFPGNEAASVVFSGDGGLLAVGDAAGQIRVWKVGTRRLAGAPMTDGHAGVTNVAFDPRGRYLGAITGGHVALWNLATRRLSAILRSDPNRSTGGLAFSPDGSTLAAVVGCDLYLWDPSTRAAIGSPIDLHYVVSLARGSDVGCSPDGSIAFARDGSLVVNLGSNGPIYVWSPLLANTSGSTFDRSICAVVARNLTRTEYSAELPGEPYHETCRGA
jgi:WD40 repeat protein